VTVTPLEMLYEHRRTRPRGIAFVHAGIAWTYEDLVDEVESVACGLSARGVRPGDRVVLHMTNVPALPIAWFACFKIGAIAVPLNVRLKTDELRSLLQQLRPALYIGEAELYTQVAPLDSSILISDARYIVGRGSEAAGTRSWDTLCLRGRSLRASAPLDPHAPALLLATSGTTGRSKFVVHTAATLAASTERCRHFAPEKDPIGIVVLPMVHAAGLFIFLTCIRLAAPCVMINRFDADAALEAIEQYKATWLVGLPFMFAELLRRQRVQPRKVHSLQRCQVAGDVCAVQLQEQFATAFHTPLRSLWGASEAVGSLTYGHRSGPVSRILDKDTVGLLDDGGAQVPKGEVGELVLRGPHVSPGYWVSPGEIESALQQGWYRTGDLMRQDEDDALWFVARKKDIIIRGGSNIAPPEVERALLLHPDVEDAAVVGVPDAELGERIVGFVRLRPDGQVSSTRDILVSTAARLADYKVPERLHVIAEIPRNAIGKIDRRRLRALTHAPSAR
jgi:long-chain acyl-CoA synthetase